jgi:beta-glucosidase
VTDDPPGPRDEALPFRDPARPFRARADDLLGRLTAEEKIAMLHQRSPAVPRLGAAEFHTGTEGVHGAAWRDHHGTGKTLPATVFPQPVGIAATWDPELGRRVGRATGREIRSLHERHPLISLNVWAPVVNPLRDPRWGRNEEGYSEDPLLTAVMGTAFCRGLSGRPGADAGVSGADAGTSGADEDTGSNGYLLTAPTLKHFLGYNNEDYRDLTSSSLRPRVLREYDLPPFREPIAAGAATGVMPSYNLVNGCPAHVSPLLAEIRTWTDEELLTCSDAWAPSNLVRTQHYFDDHPQAHAAALKAGLDSFTDQDADGEFTAAAVTEALKRGLITMDDVDRAVRRKLLVRLRLGEFDPDGGPFAGAAAMDTPEHRDLASEAARGAVVLLKNDGLLPLVPQAQRRIAVVGPLAATLYEDWYSPALPYRVTIADGLAAAWGAALEDSAALNDGAALSDGTALSDGAALNDRAALNDTVGAAVTVHEAAERVRTDLGEFDVFDWGGDVVTLRDAGTGKYLTLTGAGELAVTADKPDGWIVRETFQRQPLPGGNMLLRSTASGQAVRLRWDVLADGVAQAAEQARAADVAVVVVGNDPMIGGREARDRTTLNLPPSMDRLIREVSAANPCTVVVIMSSYPYVVPEAPNAIVWSCHAGQETGAALADVLTGRHAPGGRLPQTWYAADADLPAALDYDIIQAGWTYQYMRTTPRYPFGHGLTYTTFRYGKLNVTAAGNTVTVALDVTNTGDRPATETVQLYARYRAPDQPRRRLCGFTRLALAPGETATAVIEVPGDRLALWDVATGRLSVPAGTIEIGAGASSADIRQTAALEIPGPPRGRAAEVGTGHVRMGRVSAADFDDYANIVLAEGERGGRTVSTTSVRQERGWLLFRDFYPAGTREAVFRLAASAPGGGRVEVWLSEPGDSVPRSGRGPVASAAVPCTGDRYAWTEVRVPCDLPDGPVDLYVALSGAVWLDWFRG